MCWTHTSLNSIKRRSPTVEHQEPDTPPPPPPPPRQRAAGLQMCIIIPFQLTRRENNKGDILTKLAVTKRTFKRPVLKMLFCLTLDYILSILLFAVRYNCDLSRTDNRQLYKPWLVTFTGLLWTRVIFVLKILVSEYMTLERPTINP